MNRREVTFQFERRSDSIPPPDPVIKEYIGLYRSEGGNDHAWEQPAVIPSQWNGIKDSFGVPFTEAMQWLSWEISQYFNDVMTSNNWASVWSGDQWGTNGNGWDNENEPNDQRRDFVNDRYEGYPLPKVMDGVVFAGSIYRMKSYNGHLWSVPGVTGIDCNKAMPTVETVVHNGWFMRCMINGRKGPYDFAQGQGKPVFVPYFLIKETSYTPSHFSLWST